MKQETDRYKKYDDEIEDVDEIVGTDVKINPDFYIHNALIKAQAALTKDNVKEGFMQYRLLVEHIETLCRAAKMLDNDYDTQLDDFKKTDEYSIEEQSYVKSVKLATKQLEILMDQVFSSKVSTDPLKA